MPPKRMKPQLMWAAVKPDGQIYGFPLWDRPMLRTIYGKDIKDLYPGSRIVRVRVTQYKPRKRHAP